MAIMAVSGVKATDNIYNISFGDKKHKKIKSQHEQGTSGSNVLRRIPIIAWLAVTPAMLSSSAVEPYMQMDAEQLTEIVENMPKKDVETADFRTYQAQPQTEYPLGVAYFKDLKIQQIIPVVGNGVNANFVFTKYKKGGNPNDVDHVYYVKHSYANNNASQEPPEVISIIVHSLGDDSYLGFELLEKKYGSNTAVVPCGYSKREVKVKQEVPGQYMLDFRTNDTKWNNNTDIGFTVTTDEKAMVPVFVNF